MLRRVLRPPWRLEGRPGAPIIVNAPPVRTPATERADLRRAGANRVQGGLRLRAAMGLWGGLALIGLVVPVARAQIRPEGPGAGVPATASAPIHGDRWMEIDLYWFDRNRVD